MPAPLPVDGCFDLQLRAAGRYAGRAGHRLPRLGMARRATARPGEATEPGGETLGLDPTPATRGLRLHLTRIRGLPFPLAAATTLHRPPTVPSILGRSERGATRVLDIADAGRDVASVWIYHPNQRSGTSTQVALSALRGAAARSVATVLPSTAGSTLYVERRGGSVYLWIRGGGGTNGWSIAVDAAAIDRALDTLSTRQPFTAAEDAVTPAVETRSNSYSPPEYSAPSRFWLYAVLAALTVGFATVLGMRAASRFARQPRPMSRQLGNGIRRR